MGTNPLVMATLNEDGVGLASETGWCIDVPWGHHAADMEEMAGSPGWSCGACGSGLIGWGSYRRRVRQGPERALVRVRRRRCRRCGRTGGALPEGVLYRRLDPPAGLESPRRPFGRAPPSRPGTFSVQFGSKSVFMMVMIEGSRGRGTIGHLRSRAFAR